MFVTRTVMGFVTTTIVLRLMDCTGVAVPMAAVDAVVRMLTPPVHKRPTGVTLFGDR